MTDQPATIYQAGTEFGPIAVRPPVRTAALAPRPGANTPLGTWLVSAIVNALGAAEAGIEDVARLVRRHPGTAMAVLLCGSVALGRIGRRRRPRR